jgi:hypothetical protein
MRSRFKSDAEDTHHSVFAARHSNICGFRCANGLNPSLSFGLHFDMMAVTPICTSNRFSKMETFQFTMRFAPFILLAIGGFLLLSALWAAVRAMLSLVGAAFSFVLPALMLYAAYRIWKFQQQNKNL